VLAIPGAWSSPRIYQWLKQEIASVTWKFLEFDSAQSLTAIYNKALEHQEPCHVVGHSMGGLIALSLARQSWVKSITTISTPVGGLDLNVFQVMFSRSKLMQEISSTSRFIETLSKSSVKLPCQHIISTQGFNPWIYVPNDGVVTVKSQTAHAWGQQWMVSANHCEVMLDPQTVKILENFWKIHD
tara:strand:+ start:460 stop:1014 length:555 start_codon:yes stop_codon:yes gene_type:complete